jgi:hypothetical protein
MNSYSYELEDLDVNNYSANQQKERREANVSLLAKGATDFLSI